MLHTIKIMDMPVMAAPRPASFLGSYRSIRMPQSGLLRKAGTEAREIIEEATSREYPASVINGMVCVSMTVIEI